MQFFPTFPTLPTMGNSGRVKPASPVQADGVPASVGDGLFSRLAATARAAAGSVPIDQPAAPLGRLCEVGDMVLSTGDTAGAGAPRAGDTAARSAAWFRAAADLVEGFKESAAPVDPKGLVHAHANASQHAEAWPKAGLEPAGPRVVLDHAQEEAAWPAGDEGVPEEPAAGNPGEKVDYIPLAALGLLGSLPGRAGDTSELAGEAGAGGPWASVSGPARSLGGPARQQIQAPGLLDPLPALRGAATRALPLTSSPIPDDVSAVERPVGPARPATTEKSSLRPQGRVAPALPVQEGSRPGLPAQGVSAQRFPAPAVAAQRLPAEELPAQSFRTAAPSPESLPARVGPVQAPPAHEIPPRGVRVPDVFPTRAAISPPWGADPARPADPVAPPLRAGEQAAISWASQGGQVAGLRPTVDTAGSVPTEEPGTGGVRLAPAPAIATHEISHRAPAAAVGGQGDIRQASGFVRAATLGHEVGVASTVDVSPPSAGWGAARRTEPLPATWDLAGRPGQASEDGPQVLTVRQPFGSPSRSVAQAPEHRFGAPTGSGGKADPPAADLSAASPRDLETAPSPATRVATLGTLAWALRGRTPKVPDATTWAPARPTEPHDPPDQPTAGARSDTRWPVTAQTEPATDPRPGRPALGADAAAPADKPTPASAARPVPFAEDVSPRESDRSDRPWWFRAPAQSARPQAASQFGGERVVGADARPVDPARAGQPRNESAAGGFSYGLTQGLTDEPAPRPSHPGIATPPGILPAAHTGAAAGATSPDGRADAMGGAGRALDGGPRLFDPYVEAVGGQTAYWIRASLRAGRRETTVTLDPPQLGRLRISLVQDGPLLTARIRAELPEVESLLREGSERIRERLNSQGVRVDALVIEAAPARAARVPGAPAGHPHAQDHPGAETASHGGQRHSPPPGEQADREDGLRSTGPSDAARPARGRTASGAPAARPTWAGLDVRA